MNESILAIFLTSISVFILTFIFLASKKIKFKIYISLVLIISVVNYFFLHGRAALIGTCASIVYLYYFKKAGVSKYFIPKTITALTLAILCSIFLLKKDSSSGRLLIYKVVFTQLNTKQYITGLGIGKFKAEYNKLQAAYFKNQDRNSKTALLAGNGYYLYNDWLQLFLEIGFIKILIMACFLFIFLKLFYSVSSNNPILVSANGTLICVGTSAFFSYPLQEFTTVILFIVCLVIHLLYSYKIKEKYNSKYFKNSLTTIMVVPSLILFSYLLLIYQYKTKSKLAFELGRDGFKSKADSIYKKLIGYPFADYNTHYNYAFALYFKNELDRSLVQINKALSLAYSTDGLKLKADILYELNKPNEAEYFYKQAVNILPGRMIPKFNLLQFYIKTNQKKWATYWANEILAMPIKIQSERTNNIKEQVRSIITQIK